MPVLTDQELTRRAADLEWILCDVDGVLTCGGLFYDHRGNVVLRFNVRDGLGLKLAQAAGLRIGVISGRTSPALDKRAAELEIEAVHTGVSDKRAEFEAFLERHNTAARRVAYIGDDINDLVVLKQCGLSFAPADAVSEVKTVVHRVLDTTGGNGVVREMIEMILRARGEWDQIFSSFTTSG
jgi:3-deoxy-D-manno-octulosonate 8-phosphate phosphatase (KDO 8-P phosphatase)